MSSASKVDKSKINLNPQKFWVSFLGMWCDVQEEDSMGFSSEQRSEWRGEIEILVIEMVQ